MNCVCCNEPFQRKSGGFKRTGFFTKFKGGLSAAETLEKITNISKQFTPDKEKFICNDCSLTIKSLEIKKSQLEDVEEKFRKIRKPGSYVSSKVNASPSHRRTPKKLKVFFSPRKSTPKASLTTDKITLQVNYTKVGKAVQLVGHSRYQSGFRKLFTASKAAKSSSAHVMCDIIRREITAFTKFMGQENRRNLSSILQFNWYRIMTTAKRLCPVLLSFLTSALTKKQYQKSATKRKGKKIVSLMPIIGSVLCIIGYGRSKKCSILQQMVSIMMWLGGCKRKVFTSFNNLGWCQGIDATKSLIDNLRTDYDSKVKIWRDRVSEIVEPEAAIDESMHSLIDLEDLWESEEEDESASSMSSQIESEDETSASSPENSPNQSFALSDDLNESEQDIPIYDVNRNMYYDLTFDNINQKIGVRHHVRGKKNKMLNMVQTYATLERVGSRGLSIEMPSPETVRNIPLSDLLPNELDENMLHNELSILVSRILTKYVPAFAGLPVVWSIPHQHSTESAMKSEIVPLGILNKDESTTAGMIEILENYIQYVPRKRNEVPVPLVLFCDGLSCERVEGAQRARINGEDSWDRLDMYEPAIQEWHRRLMYLQDTYDELFSFESHREKGTLYNLKQVFDHKNVTKNMMDCFDKAEELLDFATIGYTLLLYMELTDTADISKIPEDFPQSKIDKEKFRDDISCRIIDKIYCNPNTKEVLNVSVDHTADSSQYCICKLDVGGTMVYCNNQNCEKGAWFHLECLGIDEDDVIDDDWFCCEECRQRKGRGKKTTADKLKDLKKEYAERLIWRGLNNMARHDAIKENDGPRMIMHWKFDMFEFYEKNHPKYFIFGHRLLANVAGAASEQLQHHLIWERTVNVNGGKSKNIPKDLHCEHLNMQYKENSRDAGGQLTSNTINRHSQMLGIGKNLQDIFNEQVVFKPFHTRKHGGIDRQEDIIRMIKTLQPLHYFKSQPGRSFKGFESFTTVKGVRFPKKFKERLLRHLKNMAHVRELQEDL